MKKLLLIGLMFLMLLGGCGYLDFNKSYVYAEQHDYVIDDASGVAVLNDMNNVLQSIVTNNSGATAPSPTYSNMWWYDTSTGLLKRRNNANDAWITLGLEAADTDATLAANSDSKIPTQKAVKTYIDKSIPSGVILMWSGSVESIPAGWYLCNGSNGTPDLRARFVIAAGGSYSVGTTGDGSIPAHTHSSGSLLAASAGAHTHNINAYSVHSNGNSNSCQGEPATDYTFATSSSGDHTHTISGSTGSSGSGTKNIAVYYALAYIMKGF